MSAARRVLYWLLLPLFKLVLRLFVSDDYDPWEPISINLSFRVFGTGSRHRFSWYFEKPSHVEVSSINEICEWLRGCEYARDIDLFNEPDFWQHPRTFEQLRKGDCEDHALWAWRKLIAVGIDAHLFVGEWLHHEDCGPGQHAWVVYAESGVQFLLEPVSKDTARMIQPLEEVRRQYVPHFSVNQWYRSQAYNGHLLYLKRRYAAGPPRAA